MKKILLPLTLLFLLVGCVNQAEQATPGVEAAFTLVPTLVVDKGPKEEVELPAYYPQPGDSALTKGVAMTNSVYVIYNDTDPVEVILHIGGYLPTPCHELRVVIPDPDENGDIFVEVYSLTEPNLDCEQVLRAYDISVNMGTYPRGSYWVWVNGGRVGNFDY